MQFKNLYLLNDKNLLIYNKNEYIKLIKAHKDIVIKLISDTIAFFSHLSKIPHIVFIHGSFAKTLNRINSDIDLNILYPNQFKNEILPIEEMISIILQKVIGYSGRDKIHTMMIYTHDNIDEGKIESTQECNITFPNKQIYEYKCRPNYDEVMYKIKHSSRDYNDFSNYINNNITPNKCEEWCYSYEIISTNCEEYNLYGMLKKIDEGIVLRTDEKNYNNLIMHLKSKINEYSFNINQNTTVSNINYNLKVKNLGFIYKTLAIIRRYLFVNKTAIDNLDFLELFYNTEFVKLFEAEEIKKIEDGILKYIWQLSRIEKVFNISQINFSSRNYDKFEYETIYKKYNDLYNENLKDVQNEITNELHNSLNKVLTKIEKR